MAERVEVFQCTIVANTAIAAPMAFTLSMLPGVTRRLGFIVPPGPSGLMGFRIVHSGQTVIPASGSTWIVTDDEKAEWPLDGFPTGDKWSLVGYNTDVNDHTVYLRWFLDEIPDQVQPTLSTVELG